MTDPYEGRRFEDLLAELESLTRRMATGDIGIEEATDLYEEAGRLHAAATERLAHVERRLAELERQTEAPTDTEL